MNNNKHNIQIIQKYWKLYLIRKKIRYFSQLPSDVWYLIIDKLNIKFFIVV